MGEEKEKLPIRITFEIVQDREPNDHWYDVTAVLSWEEAGFLQRMDTARCLQNEVENIQEAYQFLVGTHFAIREVKEEYLPQKE